MRTVYLGTSRFAVAVLERLAGSSHRPALVVTRPDRPRGRGRSLAPPPAADAARALGIDLAQPESVNSPEALERIAAADPEAVCICAYGGLIKEPLLSAYPMFNVHPSLLPRWRGAAPVERAIEAGDAETGGSIMRPTAELDAGPVCLQRAEPIRPDDDYGTLAQRLEGLSGALLVEALDNGPEFREQPEQGVTYAEKIEAGDRRLDPALAPDALERRVRALTPHIGAFADLDGAKRLGVRRAAVTQDGPGAEPGALVAAGERLFLGCDGGVLELLEVQPPGKRAMPAPDWLRGRPDGVRRTEP